MRPDRRVFFQEASALISGALVSATGAASAGDTQGEVPADGLLPALYFSWMAEGAASLRAHLKENGGLSLPEIESINGWWNFPYSILAPAVLYTKNHPRNVHFGDPQMLALALQIGDLLAMGDEHGQFEQHIDSYRDTYMWLEAYRILKSKLQVGRAQRWHESLQRNVALRVEDVAANKDAPAYTECFLSTSPNHYAWWAATVLVGGLTLGNRAWSDLGTEVLRRFVSTEQNPDGYWGEHNPDGPSIGYNYLTTLAVGVYWEHSHDPAALLALRRAADFHASYTYPDGHPVEIMNDRNRYWPVSPWGTFAFSHFASGRGYAEFLARHIPFDPLDMDTLGLIAQNALYYHEGPIEKCAPELPQYSAQLRSAAGIRKCGPWVVAFSGIIDTPLPMTQWFLDRQVNLSLFHERAGLIISGANSKHQPELATFSETIGGTIYFTPLGSRLKMGPSSDRLSLAHHSFSCSIVAPAISDHDAQIQFLITGRGPAPDEACMVLQLCLKPGEELVTGTGHRIKLAMDRVELPPETLGGSVGHRNWVLVTNAGATLTWPVFPYNPYRNRRETTPDKAIAALTFPLSLKQEAGRFLRTGEQNIRIDVSVTQ